MKGVVVDTIRIQKVDIALTALRFNKDCLKTTKILPGVEVALYIGWDADELLGELLCPRVINKVGVKCLNFLD
jgi:hypothetical protein